jgi:hypothetical protein
VAQVYLDIRVGAQFSLTGRISRTGPDQITGAIRPSGQGSLELRLGAKAGADELVSAEIYGAARTTITFTGAIEYRSGSDGGFFFNPQIDWGGISVSVRVITRAFDAEITNNEIATWSPLQARTVWQPESPFRLFGNP